MEDFLTQKDFEIQKELGCRISMYLGKILWQRKNVFYMIFYSVGWFDTIGKFSILREYVLKMDLMHSGNLIILYTMYRCIPSYGAHCPSRNTPQRDLRKRGDWIWGDLVAHSLFLPALICAMHFKTLWEKMCKLDISHMTIDMLKNLEWKEKYHLQTANICQNSISTCTIWGFYDFMTVEH